MRMTDFYNFTVAGIDGTPDLLGPLRGKVTLAVNVASKCGFTPQYAGLEKLYQELKERNFTVVGFPCNQFGSQEPGTATEIQHFCSSRYGVSFPLASKLEVNGANRHPLFVWLTAKANGFPGEIGWNFEKFLIGRDGRIIRRYPSATRPQDPGVLQDLVDAL
jgi:glutathione peroxidase